MSDEKKNIREENVENEEESVELQREELRDIGGGGLKDVEIGKTKAVSKRIKGKI